MGRRADPFILVRRHGSPYWYFKLGAWKRYQSTEETVKAEALKITLATLVDGARHRAGQ